MTTEDFGDVRVMLMRFTVFCKTPRTLETDLFKRLTGTEPNQTTRDNGQSLLIEQGKHPEFKGGGLRVVQQGARIDVVLEAADNAAPTRIEDITFAPEMILIPITVLANKVFSSHSEIVRIAFAANLVFSNEKGGALMALKRLLPHLSSDLERASEFTYKLNRITDIDGLTVNRLSNWEIARLFARAISAGQFVLAGMQAAMVGHDFGELLSLEVECNTDAARTKPLEHSEVGRIFERLVHESATIAKQGHI